MPSILLRFGAAFSLMTALPAMAQTAPAPAAEAPADTTSADPAAAAPREADPALWVVRDKDTTIYLFGTIHVLKPGLSWFDEAVKTAFDKSNEVVLEIPMPTPEQAQAAVMKSAVNVTGPKLSEKLPAAERDAYARAVADAGLPAGALEQLDPWFAASTLTLVTLQKQGYDPQSGAEQTISQAAKVAGKPVTGLETLEQQFGFFDALSDAAQVTFLSETIKELPTAGEQIDKMVDQWAKGDPAALAATMNEDMTVSPELRRVLLTDRNARWAKWIEERMKRPGTVFVAVGAGHLAGTGSVQDALKRYKLRATRVKY
ncbi:polysaccharide biosynthesis protein GumN [Sphingomonas sp. Leaf22]|uniref:TraB/GumN family protein n=1 Tax=unclassified Sphingomonas TaxID=196159 RepID=UPI0006F8470B|nr:MULTISPECIES: TraB/GumN family protein [unclassified Sphingomonas]KQM94147.1 polysaccharide biosynthesis protein GumN [Sphingomonas sp. Leaf22]KQN76544.1 polysaccharide biosynthesis protein GumN [Sphingomonas sp. Leaf62]